MKIDSISVKKLFGIFNHEINFRTEDITILIGENGLGKTVLLEMLNNIFNMNFHDVINVKFEKLHINFSNKVEWIFRVNNNNLEIRDAEKTSNRWQILYDNKKTNLRKTRQYIKQNIYREIDENYINHMDIEDIEHYLHNNINYNISKRRNKSNPSWFLDIQKKINIDLIETQRILTNYGNNKDKYKSTIMDCAENLKNRLINYSSLSQKITAELDSSFPNRIIASINKRKKNRFNK